MVAKRIMIQATGFGTGAGKSFMVALLSRLFSEDGYKVAPYKTINMTPVTFNKGAKEFGYSQALQAVAAGQEPDYRMNPCTVKPLGDGRFNILLEGECILKDFDPQKKLIKATLKNLFGVKQDYRQIEDAAKRCLESLLNEYDIVCIEGSGPAQLLGFGPLSELHEIANMGTARMADSSILLVTDNLDSIPGVLSYIGEESRRIKGVLLNRFISHEFSSMGIKEKYIRFGVARIKSVYRRKIGREILGVIPYFAELAEFPDLDPLVPSPRIDFDAFQKVIIDIAKRTRKNIDLNEIYRIMVRK